MAAAANKDSKTARSHFERCSDLDTYCHWQAAVVSQKAGDAAGAEAARARLNRAYQRDPTYLYAWGRMKDKATAKVSN
jgi:hypothetical protein